MKLDNTAAQQTVSIILTPPSKHKTELARDENGNPILVTVVLTATGVSRCGDYVVMIHVTYLSIDSPINQSQYPMKDAGYATICHNLLIPK